MSSKEKARRALAECSEIAAKADNGTSFGKVLGTGLKIIGIGIAAGIVLISATDAIMNKAFPQDEDEEEK